MGVTFGWLTSSLGPLIGTSLYHGCSLLRSGIPGCRGHCCCGCLLFSWYECDLTNTHGEAALPRDKAQVPANILAEYYSLCWKRASLLWNVAAFLSGRGQQQSWSTGNVCVLVWRCAVTVPGWEGVVYLILRWPFPGDYRSRCCLARKSESICCCCLAATNPSRACCLSAYI